MHFCDRIIIYFLTREVFDLKRFMDSRTLIIIMLLFASSIFSGRFTNPGDWLMSTLLMLPAVLIGLSLHEFGHAAVAYKLGDNTPYYQGRVTINPGAHIDPVGFVCLLLIGFGWGNPVQINPGNFKKPRRDELLVSLAGVVMNFIVAVLFAVLLRILVAVAPDFFYGDMGGIVMQMILNIVLINIVLMVFNLIPVPPLDGFNVVTELFNLRRYNWWYTVYNNGFFILLILILFNITDLVLSPGVLAVYNLIMDVLFAV